MVQTDELLQVLLGIIRTPASSLAFAACIQPGVRRLHVPTARALRSPARSDAGFLCKRRDAVVYRDSCA